MNFSHTWLQFHFNDKLPTPEKLGEVVGLHAFEWEGTEEAPHGDILIDWDVLPNRSSDCLSYQGMAREVAAVLDIPYKKWVKQEILDTVFDSSYKTSDFVTVQVADKDLVKRASKRLATGVQVGPSPQWLVELLESIGQKSINNVVDITNYVMWETGQPVHAFDFDTIAGGDDKKTITIRFAKDGEKITDLTGLEHELDSSMLVIADSEKALDIAGVKGGLGSGVSDKTTRVLLSACNFDFQNIRNTSRKLKLHTDASKRFENEVPLNKIDDAMVQFSYLMQELTGAKVSEEIVDTAPELPTRDTIALSVATTNSILGLQLTKEEIISLLKRVGCEVLDGEESFAVTVPYDRLDLGFAGDLIEEVGRLYGYENLQAEMPVEGFVLPEISSLQQVTRTISDILVTLGFYETKARTLGSEGVVELTNPLNANAGFLRSHLGGELVKKAERNLAHTDEPRLFEIGKVFSGVSDTSVTEVWHWAGVIGKRKIKDKQKQEVFLQTKGVLETVFAALGVKNITWEEHIDEEAGSIATVLVDGTNVGLVGVNWWEINVDILIGFISPKVVYKKTSKYPKIDRDVAVFVPSEVTVACVQDLIQNELPQETVNFELFDVFEKEGKKSFAFRMVFQSDVETLSDVWANNVMDGVYKKLEQEGYEIR